jgi:hypothetical protein
MDFKLWQSRIRKGDPYVRSRPQLASPGNDEFDLNIFLLAAIWADEIKGDPRFQNEKSSPIKSPILPSYFIYRQWHFYDQSFTTDEILLPPPSSPNMLEVLPILRDGMSNPQLKPDAQAYNLVWLIHLIGDAHQPLHCATRVSKLYPSQFGDSGGNAFKILSAGQPTTLHTYWDGLLGTYSVSTFKKEADKIMNRYKPKEARDLSEEVWIKKESFEIAEKTVYSVGNLQIRGVPVVSKTYDSEAKRIARERVTLAGYRLGDILNERLK